MKECLEIALKTLHGLRIELRIMESRPGCEGAFLASALSNAFNVEGDDGDMRGSTLSIQVEPDSSVAMLAKDVSGLSDINVSHKLEFELRDWISHHLALFETESS